MTVLDQVIQYGSLKDFVSDLITEEAKERAMKNALFELITTK